MGFKKVKGKKKKKVVALLLSEMQIFGIPTWYRQAGPGEDDGKVQLGDDVKWPPKNSG